MAKFRKENKKGTPAISTASIPDIVFMLLFFFMVSTTMKNTTLKIRIQQPFASEVKKLEKKSLVSFINIGTPVNKGIYGTAPRIQVNDAFISIDDVREYIENERQNMSENDRPKMMVSLKADRDTEMGIVTGVKQELRKASALKINYSTKKGNQKQIFKNLN